MPKFAAVKPRGAEIDQVLVHGAAGRVEAVDRSLPKPLACSDSVVAAADIDGIVAGAADDNIGVVAGTA